MHCYTALFLSIRYKFDDERVTKEDMKRALEEQYGGVEEVKASINIGKIQELTYRNRQPQLLYIFFIFALLLY